MDSLDLLAREDEFKKLNKQLEKKTESLMKDIERAMQKQDIFSEFSHSLSITPHSTPKRHVCPPPPQDVPPKPVFKRKTLKSKHITDEAKSTELSLKDVGETLDAVVTEKRVVCDCCDHSRGRRTDDEQFLQAFVSVGVQEKVFPQSFLKDNISVENICKFLSTKVKLMQEQIEKLQVNLDKKAIQCKAHLTQQAELEGERLTLLNKNNNLRAAAADAKAKCMALENRLSEKDRLNKEQRSECDRQSSELKRTRAELSAAASRRAAQQDAVGHLTQQLTAVRAEYTCSELKRTRAELTAVASRRAAQQDAVGNLTQQLTAVRAEYAEFRESTRQLSISHQQTIANLEALINALTSTTDKQTALIDNLRRQNAILAAERALVTPETDYWQLLNRDS